MRINLIIVRAIWDGYNSEKHIKIYNTKGQLLLSKKTFDTHLEVDVEKFRTEKLLIAHIVFDQNSVFKKVLLER